VPNLGNAIETLKSMGYLVIGLDGEGPIDIARAAADARGRPAALVLGAEGPGLRARTRELCDVLARIPAAGGIRVAQRLQRRGGEPICIETD
jgi:23S rRNA (guanosine2251-2'-O)-methyltransferase